MTAADHPCYTVTSLSRRLDGGGSTHQLTVSAALDPRCVGQLRAMSRVRLKAWGLAALTDTVELLISEIVGNAVRHTSSDSITVSLSCGAGAVRLEVVDGTAGLPRMRRPGPDEESGRGLLIVDALAEQWGTSPDGSTTWCTVPIPAGDRLDSPLRGCRACA